LPEIGTGLSGIFPDMANPNDVLNCVSKNACPGSFHAVQANGSVNVWLMVGLGE
jgi:hypothetical protein